MSAHTAASKPQTHGSNDELTSPIDQGPFEGTSNPIIALTARTTGFPRPLEGTKDLNGQCMLSIDSIHIVYYTGTHARQAPHAGGQRLASTRTSEETLDTKPSAAQAAVKEPTLLSPAPSPARDYTVLNRLDDHGLDQDHASTVFRATRAR